jgi:ABC-type branched-subunit amino acid transport system substrate-binding protein
MWPPATEDPTGFGAGDRDTIKVGSSSTSLSGTMAISETTLKDTMLMLIDEQNKKGGLLGKKLEAVVVDPASNWPLFAEKAANCCKRRRSRRCSAAGPRCRASRCCRCSRN